MSKNERFVYNRVYKNYGKVILTVGDILKKRELNTYRLSVLTGINWNIVKKYVNGSLYRVDLDLLSRMCYALDCSLDDLIHYENVEKTSSNIKSNANKNKLNV